MKQSACRLCGKTFICDNGRWSTTCTCAKDRPAELKVAQEKFDRECPLTADGGRAVNPTDQLILDALNAACVLESYLGDRPEVAAVRRIAERVRELEAERAGLTWSDEKPTVPGWYWYRESPIHPGHIGTFADKYGPRWLGSFVGLLTGQFAGPIPPPGDPQA